MIVLTNKWDPKWILILFLMLSALWFGNLRAQCSQDFDLNDFNVAGPLGNGIWTISPDGSSAQQMLNGKPTFLVSPQELVNVRITGTVRIDSLGTDNDYIGFVFGVQEPTTYSNDQVFMDMWLLDWKALGQNSAEEGFSLIRLNDTFDFSDPITFMPYFWTHNTYSGFEISETNYGPGLGWATDTDYEVEITLLYNRTIVKIDGQTILDKQACFDPGRFGFYSFSQEGVRFDGFETVLIPDFELPEEVCRNEPVQFHYTDANCNNEDVLVNNIVSQVQWDFNDGGTSNFLNPTHEFSEPGGYLVSMTVTDSNGCQDQIEHFFEVLNGPTAAFSVDDACIGETASFNNLSNSNGLNILSTEWDIDSDGVIDYFTPEITHSYTQNGSHEATLIVNGTVCSDTVSHQLDLFPAPEASFEITQIGTTRAIEIDNFTQDAESIQWDFGDPNSESDVSDEFEPSYIYPQDGEYTVTLIATNSGACSDTLRVKKFVNFIDNTFIPSAFSPNGDGKNDLFRLLGTTLSDIDMLIFNQWGELIYSGSDQGQGWDGSIKGEVGEPGNYTYVIEGIDSIGEDVLYKGIVTLIR